MGTKKTTLIILFFLTALASFATQKDSLQSKPTRFSVALGNGWTHYIDNLDYGNQNLNKDFAGLSLRFLWEPEYRLSLGAETGYYTMFFKFKNQTGSATTGEITRRITPILLLVRMRIIDHFYLSTGFGLALLTSSSKGAEQNIVTNTMSLSNYQFTASYIYPLSPRVQLGGEAKLFNFGAYNDWMYSLQAFCAYRF